MNRPAGAAIILAGLLVGSDLPSLALEPPILHVEAPDSMASIATQVEGFDRARLLETMRMVGLDRAGPPIRVILAPEGSPPARAAPPWATGYADGAAGTIVLIPSRSSSYPYGSLEALLHHEVAHVLIARAAKGGSIPRWFNEGVAMAAARSWSIEDRTRLVIELLPGGRLGFDRVDALFGEGEARARRAYALSGAFVRDLLQRYGIDLPGRILVRIADGSSFEEAFHDATGTSLEIAQGSFYRSQNLWSRWIPFLTSSFTLWTGITLLALYAMKKRRERDARLAAEWEREESAGGVPTNGAGGTPTNGERNGAFGDSHPQDPDVRN